MRIYMDNSATTRVDEEVAGLVYKVMTEEYGNPSSLHHYGVTAENYLEKVREFLLHALGDRWGEIIFTSGGTEGNNLAIRGAAYRNIRKGQHIITGGIEHPSVLEVFRALEREGFQVTYLPVNASGEVDLEELKQSLTDETTLVSVQTINNEVGTIQPIQEIGALIYNYNAKNNGKILFHTDAVQAVGKINIDVKKCCMDLLTLSGHKFQAPKGIGALYMSQGTLITPLMFGGGQENGLRPGTENVPGILGLGKALEKTMNRAKDWEAVKWLKTRLVAQLKEALGDALMVLGPPPQDGAPHILYLGFRGVQGEVMIHALEQRGLYVSTGSACRSNKDQEESPVLHTMEAPPDFLRGAVRLSFNLDHEQAAFDYAGKQLISAYHEVSKYS